MTDKHTRPRRVVARRALAMGTVAATALGSGAHAGPGATDASSSRMLASGEGGAAMEGEAAATGKGEASAAGEGEAAAGGEGEGEGEGAAPIDPEIAFLRDLAFMEGHLRAGMALYEQGDLQAAKTHMGHPIEEKYGAVADRLDDRGFGDLEGQIAKLADAAEAETDMRQIRPMFDTVRSTMESVRADSGGAVTQLKSLAALARIAAEEYAAGVKDGDIANLHEYQDSWGFLRAVETEARQFAESDDPGVAEAANRILAQVEATQAAYGDLQGEGDFETDAAILYGAAARMEFAALAAE